MHQHGDTAVQHCTKVVLAKTSHIERLTRWQYGSEGKLENVAMSLYARAREHSHFHLVQPPHQNGRLTNKVRSFTIVVGRQTATNQPTNEEFL